jgi:hypothetical protein
MTNLFWHPVLPHECGVPLGYGTPHLCGSEEFCRAPWTRMNLKPVNGHKKAQKAQSVRSKSGVETVVTHPVEVSANKFEERSD